MAQVAQGAVHERQPTPFAVDLFDLFHTAEGPPGGQPGGMCVEPLGLELVGERLQVEPDLGVEVTLGPGSPDGREQAPQQCAHHPSSPGRRNRCISATVRAQSRSSAAIRRRPARVSS